MVDIVSILLIIAFCTILCLVEIPRLLRKNQYREFGTFAVLLGAGIIFALMKFSGMTVPNPSDLILWVYSPFKEIMQSLLK
jgi:hypothetical protein